MSLEFYILRHGRREGPLTEEEILDCLDLGHIDANDLCIDSASGQKRQVGELFQIVGEPRAPSAPDKSEIPEASPPRSEPAAASKPAPPSADSKEDVPKAGKRLIYLGHPSWVTYWRSFALAVVVAIGGYFGGAISGYFGLAAWLWCSLTLVYIMVDRTTRDYVVTSARVEIITGLFSKSSREVRIDDIRAINVHTKGLLGLIGIGTVEFASAGTNTVDVAFQNVWRAHKLKAIVRRLQDE